MTKQAHYDDNRNPFVGYAKVAINYPFPSKLGGYLAERFAYDSRSDFYIRCISFKTSAKRIYLLSLDLVGIDHLIIDPIQKQLEADESIMLCASHTHSAPAGTLDTLNGPLKNTESVFGLPNESLIQHIIDACLKAINQSKTNQQPALIQFASTDVVGVGANRNDPSRYKGNPRLASFVITRNDNTSLILYNFACHPTILKPDNLSMSEDLIGPVTEHLEKTYDLAFFMNANAGDISTRYTMIESSFAEVERLGTKLFDAFSQLSYTPPVPLDHVALTSFTLPMLQKNFDTFEGNYTFFDIQGYRIIGVPGEITSELSNSLLELDSHYLISSCTNGYNLYLADEDNYKHNYYESEMSPFEYGVGEAIMSRIIEKLND